MANTKVTNIQLPLNFAEYVVDESTLKSNLFNSGVVVTAPGIAITKGAKLPMPFIKPLTRGATPLSDTTPLAAKNVTTDQTSAIVHSRGDAFSVNDLASAYSGEDFVGFIKSALGQYWADEWQAQVIATLKGVFLGAGMSTHIYDGSSAAWSAANFLKAQFAMGDARGKLAAILVHSSAVAAMEAEDNSVQREKLSNGTTVVRYRGLQVIEADELATETYNGNTGVATAYLLGAGAFGYANGLDLAEVETDRNILAGDTVITSRQSYVLHPQGFKTNLDIGADGASPTNTQLANASAFTASVDLKNIPMVAYKYKA